jgi:hypothetical protein
MLISLQRGLNLFAKRSKLETGHGVGVYVLAVPEGEAAVRTLHLEPELLIEGDTGGVSKYENAAGSLPCSYRRRRRRAVGISESVESAEDVFAERHGYADIHAKLQNAGGQVSRLTEPG